MGLAMAAAAVLLLWLQRDLTYVSDELLWLPLSTEPLGDLIKPYGGHLILVPLLVYRAIQDAFGTSFTAFGIVQVTGVLAVGGLVFEYARRRLGPVLALAVAVPLLFLGSGWAPLMEPLIGIEYVSFLIPGIAALLLLERGDRKGDVAACALLCVAVAAVSSGVAFLVGGAVSVLLSPGWRRRAWIVLVPLLPYAAWRLWALHFGGAGLRLSNVVWLPAYFVDSVAAVGAGLFGLAYQLGSGTLTALHLHGFTAGKLAAGLALVAVEAAVVVLIVRRVRRRGPAPRSLWVALAVLAALWTAQGLALGPTRAPTEIRFLYPATALSLLVVAELAAGVRPGRAATIAVLALAAVSVAANVPQFRYGRRALVAYTQQTAAQIAVLKHGSIKVAADRFLALVYDVKLGGAPSDYTSCTTVRARHGAPAAADLPRGGAVLQSPRALRVQVERFSDSYPVDLGRLRRFVPAGLAIPADPATIPWRVRASGAGEFAVCEPR
jgi:hypothetical protein